MINAAKNSRFDSNNSQEAPKAHSLHLMNHLYRENESTKH